MLKPVTVMFTASGSQFAPGIVKCLRGNGERSIRVVGGDMSDDPTNNFIVDAFHRIPAATTENYAEAVLDICKKEHVDVLLPQMSAELPVYRKNIKRFEDAGIHIAMTKEATLDIANNKLNLFEFMDERSIPHADFRGVRSFDEFEQALNMLDYPKKAVCVKMTELSGSRGIRVIDANVSKFDVFAHEKPSSLIITKDDMVQILSDAPEFPELLVMEYMPGSEYTIGLLADKGDVLRIAGRRSPSMVMSIAQESIVEKNDRAYKIAKQVAEELRLSGVIGMDFMFDSNGEAQLMEINPRVDATVSAFTAAGLNLPYLCIKQILGEELPQTDIHYGTRLKRRYLETFTDSKGNRVDF